MASFLSPSPDFHLARRGKIVFGHHLRHKKPFPSARCMVEVDVPARGSVDAEEHSSSADYGVVGVHHVGILCENLERSLHFYQNILGLSINEARPHDKLPYRGAWLWVGSEMIHLMELPNPDPLTGRPEHGGRDRHACIAIQDVLKLKKFWIKPVYHTLSVAREAGYIHPRS